MVRYIPSLFEPYRSKCRVYLSGANQIIPYLVFTTVQFNTKDYDVNDEFDISNYRFTAKESGYYLINVTVRWGSSTDQLQHTLAIVINGSNYKSSSTVRSSGSSAFSQSLSDIIYLNKGDYIEIQVFTTVSGGSSLEAGENRTFMSIHRLS